MSVVIFSPGQPSAARKTIQIPDPATYNKHIDGPEPATDDQRTYIKHQRAAYNTNLVRLYYAFEDIMRARLAELHGDADAVIAETCAGVQAQAQHLYYDRVWRKNPPMNAPDDYLTHLYRFWRDIGASREHHMYDGLWEFVAERELPTKLLTAPHERRRWT